MKIISNFVVLCVLCHINTTASRQISGSDVLDYETLWVIARRICHHELTGKNMVKSMSSHMFCDPFKKNMSITHAFFLFLFDFSLYSTFNLTTFLIKTHCVSTVKLNFHFDMQNFRNVAALLEWKTCFVLV